MALPNKEERDWSDLPHDIVGHIIEKLYNWPDRIRVRAVCKNWHRVSHNWIPTIDKGAWIMSYRWLRLGKSGLGDVDKVYSICLLSDYRVSKTIYCIEEGFKEENERGLFVEASLQSCKYGWVLFQKHQEENPSRCYCFFLFSPFTNEVLELPKLELNSAIRRSSVVATFNLSSTSSDCLVFCLQRDHDNGTIHISTCRPGDKTWKTNSELELEGSYYNRPLACNLFGSNMMFLLCFRTRSLRRIQCCPPGMDITCKLVAMARVR
ncbi:hypothetical protein COLO4_17685 [Corchorus olitorius]|uniref:F-box domain-containing protein n=1 Tax=Corchorus olitorius TaxID=93759 RepID=A0A1R3JC03_9ROSI|nr:hypothetical protein COLO4_17685 [Corchorus olitorius]